MNKQAKGYFQRKFKLEEMDFSNLSSDQQMPIIEGTQHIPSRIVDLDVALRRNEHSCGVHTFLDDYKIDRLWNDTEYYIRRLRPFDCVFSPDFSLLIDMPKSAIMWNSYRSKLVGQMFQQSGICVIPTVSWAAPNTYNECFAGLPQKSVVAVSTLGIMQRRDALRYFLLGFKEMLKRLSPTTVVLYGLAPHFDFDTPAIVHFENTNLAWKDSYQPVLLNEVI